MCAHRLNYSRRGFLALAGAGLYLNPPKNTPSIAAGLDGDEFGIVGASPTINSCYNTREYDLKSFRVSPKGFPI
jgi:hypothetical protein